MIELPGSMKNLPNLQELVLADNQLAELGERSFEVLPNLQVCAIHSTLVNCM